METKLSADDLLTIQELVELLAPRVKAPGDSLRQAKDKVRKRLLYSHRSGELVRFEAQERGDDGRFWLGCIVAWGREKWPGKLTDLPARHNATVEERFRSASSAFGDVVPTDLPQCREALRACQAQVRLLEAKLAEHQREIGRLKQLADRYESNRAKNRESARKPRKKAW